MKNLKKVLALVLVVATLMGFATVAGAKDFTDASSIKNTEAVEVMSALEVITGYTDGSFKPNGNVTRAEMAKMVSFILNGGADVGPMYSAGNVYADCGYHWARGYIAYAANAKLVAGVGNNKFNPDGNVTGVEAAKMLLCALGFDAEREGIKGSVWASKTLSLAKEVGLLADFDSKFDYSLPLNRDNAALMMLNALQCTMVEYPDDATSIKVNGEEITIGGQKHDKRAPGTEFADSKANIDDANTLELGEYSFDGKKGVKLVNGYDDAFGRPGHQWWYKGEEINTYMDTPDLTYTAKVKGSDIFNDSGKIKIKNDSDYAQQNYFKIFEDGLNVYDDGAGYNTGTYKDFEIAAGDTHEFGRVGAKVEIYFDDELECKADGTETNQRHDNARIVVVNTYYGEINKFYPAKTDKNSNVKTDAYITLKGTVPLQNASATLKDKKFETDAFTSSDEDAKVYFTAAHDGSNKYVIKSVDIAESFEGTMSRYTGENVTPETVTVGGTKYDVSSHAGTVESAKEDDFDGTYTFYTDPYGNVIAAAVVEAGANSNYVYVQKYEEKLEGFDNDTGVRAWVVHTDGKRELVDVDTFKASQNDADNNAGINKDDVVFKAPTAGNAVALTKVDSSRNTNGVTVVDDWYRYTINSNNEYTFREIDDNYAKVESITADSGSTVTSLTKNNASIALGKAGASSYYLNSKTVVTNIDTDYKVTTFTGLPKRDASFNVGSKMLIVHSKGSNAATAIYVAGQDDSLSNDDATYAYLMKYAGKIGGDDAYTFVVDGELVTYINKSSVTFDVDKAGTHGDDVGKIYNLTLDASGDSEAKITNAKCVNTGGVTNYSVDKGRYVKAFEDGVLSVGNTLTTETTDGQTVVVGVEGNIKNYTAADSFKAAYNADIDADEDTEQGKEIEPDVYDTVSVVLDKDGHYVAVFVTNVFAND